jgi:hypothetical protein
MSEGQPDGKEKYLVGEDKVQRDLNRSEKKILEGAGYKIEKVPAVKGKDKEKGAFGIDIETLKKAEEEYKEHYSEDEEHYWDK